MTNPFDNQDATFRVLVNAANQHSLWPDFADVPRGWVAVFGPDSRKTCVDYVTQSWQDITPIAEGGRAAS